MRPLTVTVPGSPMGKGRPRFSRKSGTAFTPAPTRNREAYIKLLATQEMAGRAPFEGALMAQMAVVFDVPPSWPKKKQAAALLGEVRPIVRPDLDNQIKLVTDALNGVVYRDDAQIVEMRVTKSYGPQALTVITVRPIDPSEPRNSLGHGL